MVYYPGVCRQQASVPGFLKLLLPMTSVCVCVCVFIPGSELLITSSVMWTPHDWLN